MKIFKTNRAITLVSLIVTIIILLILAGVALNLILKYGLFEKTDLAVVEHEKQEATEKMNLKVTSLQMKNYAEKQTLPTLQELADGLCEDAEMEYVLLESQKTASLDKIEVGNAQSIFTKLKKYPYEFEINSKLQLASIDGVKIADNTEPINKETHTSMKQLFSIVYSSGATVIGPGRMQIADFMEYTDMSEDMNDFFEFDTETHNLVCKKAGQYILNASVRGARNTDGALHCGFIINGSDITWSDAYANASNTEVQSGNIMTIYLNQGDTVNFFTRLEGRLVYFSTLFTVYAN